MRKNTVKTFDIVYNEEGAPVRKASPIVELRRTAYAALLFEDTFYESGGSIAERIRALVAGITDTQAILEIAVYARTELHLRHVPLLIVREMARTPHHRHMVKAALEQVIQRADEPAEFMALYWDEGRQPIAASVKKGLGNALARFGTDSLSKYDRRSDKVRMRDVLRLVHGKPVRQLLPEAETKIAPAIDKPGYKRGATVRNSDAYTRLNEDRLEPADTWEVSLSADDGVEKKEKWERLLVEEKLGDLALLRNLSGMVGAGVENALIEDALAKMSGKRVLPFRYVAADRATDGVFRVALNRKMSESIVQAGLRFDGKTAVLVDVSSSMAWHLSSKSDMNRMDAATALAVIAAQMGDVEVYTFSDSLVWVKVTTGLHDVERINRSQPNNGTAMAQALIDLFQARARFDRVIVVTDEQAQDADKMPRVPRGVRGYIINVAPYQHGVSYGDWIRINGFSESVFRYLCALENEFA